MPSHRSRGLLVVGGGLEGRVADAFRGGSVRDGGPQTRLLAGGEVEHDVADTRVTLGLLGAAARLFLADQGVHLGAVVSGRTLGGPDRQGFAQEFDMRGSSSTYTQDLNSGSAPGVSPADPGREGSRGDVSRGDEENR